MHDRHEPDPRFLEGLEWQLSRELRRVKRTGTGPQPAVRVLKIGSLMAVSLVLGAAAMGFRQQLNDAWRRELLEARLQVQLQLAQQRVAVQLQALGLTREEVARGVRNDRDLLYFELQIAQAEVDARIKALELEEIRLSGREPQDALSSPLVDGRDFVSEKLQARMEVAHRHLDVVRSDAELSRQRAEAGVVSEGDVLARSMVALEAELRVEELTRQLDIRRAYLNSEITAVEAELRQLEVEAQNRVILLIRRREYFQHELERYQTAIDAGSLRPAGAAALRTEMAEIEGQLRLAQAELDIVQRELEKRGAER